VTEQALCGSTQRALGRLNLDDDKQRCFFFLSARHPALQDSYRTHVPPSESSTCVAGCKRELLGTPRNYFWKEFGDLFARVVVKPAGQINRRSSGVWNKRLALCVEFICV
jgi:hypothetical protein